MQKNQHLSPVYTKIQPLSSTFYTHSSVVGAGIARPNPAGTNALVRTILQIELGRAMPAPTMWLWMLYKFYLTFILGT
ncbi:MAG: hypothetical protein FWD97_06705 [Defluviitaleaceae bacterium]|nr:hypothetical protein [Defluviitaleaceae bacterium]